MLTVGLLVFPKVQQLDLTGPYEVFASIPGARRPADLEGSRPDRLGHRPGAGPGHDDWREAPQLDVLCVPGGAGVNALMEDEEVLDFLRRQSEGARFVSSVCSGALVLAAAGLLNGRRATTHWASHDYLARLGAVPEQARVVVDGRFISGGGVTAGIDMALTLTAELLGREQAEAIQLWLEYAPAPPFAAGHPDTAPAEIVARVRAATSGAREAREQVVRRIEARRAG